jgi:hypothetical protein
MGEVSTIGRNGMAELLTIIANEEDDAAPWLRQVSTEGHLKWTPFVGPRGSVC